jgi:putative ABC transport system substrate-binding protein
VGKGQIDNAARMLGVNLVALEARNAEELDAALRALPHSAADGVHVSGDSLLYINKAKVAQAVRNAKIPGVFPWREYHDDEVLMSYGPNLTEVMRRVPMYIDRIVKGSKPADIPVEQISIYELIINLRIARELGLAVPQSVLLLADEVIR